MVPSIMEMGSSKLVQSKQLLYWLVVAYSILSSVAAPNNETDPLSAFKSVRRASSLILQIWTNHNIDRGEISARRLSISHSINPKPLLLDTTSWRLTTRSRTLHISTTHKV